MFNQKEYVKKWQEEHSEHLKSYRKKYYEQHKDYYREYRRIHYTKKALYCKVCGKEIKIGKFCDKCAIDTTKVSRQVAWLRRKKMNICDGCSQRGRKIMKTTADTIAVYSSSMRSCREPTTILSAGEECSYEGQDGKMRTGKILEISTNGHCWIEHEGKVYAVPYSHIYEKRRQTNDR